MTRLPSFVLAVGLGLGLTACDKPTPDDCRKALANMQHLLGTENLNTTGSLEGEVRRCRGGSKRAAVACAIKATTLDELRACDFEKVPGKAPAGSGHATINPAPAGSATAAVPTGAAAAEPAGSAAATPAGTAATAPAGSAGTPTGSAR